MTLALLPNPERDWLPRPAAGAIDLSEIQRRIGPCKGPARLLAGGLANTNVLVDGRVLRIYRRDPSVAKLEARLLRHGWSSFQVPAVLCVGDDFLLLEYVPHRPLSAGAEHGAAVGRALAEVHAMSFAEVGFLDPALRVSARFDDLLTELIGYARSELASAPASIAERVSGRVLQALQGNAERMRALAGVPRLLHGDFKSSNLHWTDAGRLLVLDWEFAYSGASLSDVGQLLRWQPPTEFVAEFAAAYRACGGVLPEEFQRWAALFDLVNLTGLLANLPWTDVSSTRLRQVRRRIEQTLTASETDGP